MTQPTYTVNTQANFLLGGGDLFATAAIIGEADSGDDDVVKVFSTFTELKAYYTAGILVDAAELFFNNGGRLLTTLKIVDASTDQNYIDALTANLQTKDWDYLIIPGNTDDLFHASIVTEINNRAANENKYSTFVTGVDKFEAIATSTARAAVDIDGTIVLCHSALFTGNADADITDTANWKDASYTAAALTGLLCSLPVNDSPTYKPVNIVAGKTLAANDYTTSERNTLTSDGFIVIDKTFTDIYGIILGVTRTGDSAVWPYLLDSKRKVDYIKENAFEISKGYFGNPNDAITRQAIKADISTFLTNTKKDRIIEDFEVEVIVGTTAQSIIINTSVKLISEVNFITFNLTLNI